MKGDKELKKGEIDGRYFDGMSIVKWLDNKPVLMLSTIDSGALTNTTQVKRRQKGQAQKVDVKVPAMVDRYNKKMRGTDLHDQKTTVYAYDRKSPGKYYCRPFWDYIDMSLVNAFILYQKLAQTLPSTAGRKVVKTQKDFRRAVAISLISDYTSRARDPPAARLIQGANSRHHIQYAESHGRCKNCYKEGKDRKVFIRCVDCGVYLCLNKNNNCWETYHESL